MNYCCVLDKYSVISQVRICIIPLWREAMWEPSVWPNHFGTNHFVDHVLQYIRLKTSDLKSYPCVCLFYNDLLMWNVYTMLN